MKKITHEQNSKIQSIKAFPVTISLSSLQFYNLNPLLEVVRDSTVPFFDDVRSRELFLEYANDVYIPILEFILSQGLQANVICTGKFLTDATKHSPSIIKLLKQLITNQQINIVADAYCGNSLTCMYNSFWWSDSIVKTLATIKQILRTDSHIVYISQLYRGLELERVTQKTTITKFLSRQKGKKPLFFTMSLMDLRRFQNHEVSWISEEDNKECDFYFIPDSQFFTLNETIFQSDVRLGAKVGSMAIGLSAAEYSLKKGTSKARITKLLPRLSEKYSLSLYNPLQRAVIRLWEYASALIMTEHHNRAEQFPVEVFDQFEALQNKDFLLYLEPSFYLSGNVENFSSPYEAFVNMQSSVKQIEILLKNRL